MNGPMRMLKLVHVDQPMKFATRKIEIEVGSICPMGIFVDGPFFKIGGFSSDGRTERMTYMVQSTLSKIYFKDILSL